jgi:hypothetical protein
MSKITTKHLARSAYVYIRQSTADQLTHNHESRRRQYGLANRARQLGCTKHKSGQLPRRQNAAVRIHKEQLTERRRDLAKAQREREQTHNALLTRLITTERSAAQLREWIEDKEQLLQQDQTQILTG